MDGVDVEEVKRRAGQLSDEARIFRPLLETGASVGAVVFGVALGVALVPLLNVALAPAFIHDLFSRGTRGTSSYESSPSTAYLVSGIALAVLRTAWLWLRQKP